MLWTDGPFITTQDLLDRDPDITEVMSSQSMALIGMDGIIQRGVDDAGIYLESKLVSFVTYISSNDLSANHLAAVFYTGSAPNQRRRTTLEMIVVDGESNPAYQSAIKRWAINRVLLAFYLSASSRSQGDRYTERKDMWLKTLIQESWPMLQKSGIPIVYRPMAIPAAACSRNPGTWTSINTHVGAPYTATGPFYVTISYVDQSRYISPTQTQNGEGGPAIPQLVTLTAGDAIQLNLGALIPPNGAVAPEMIARGFTVPLNATGINVYVGLTSGGPMFLQNSTPIPIPNNVPPSTYVLPADPVLSGPLLYTGQYPEAYLSTQDLIQRG